MLELRDRVRIAIKQPTFFRAPKQCVDNHRYFRDFLFHRQPPGKTLTLPNFGAPTEEWRLSPWSHLPSLLAGWCWNSRRVYHLRPELQRVLEHTTLEQMTWEDIHPPFRSFAIQLSVPQKTGDNKDCDVILVHSDPNGAWGFATLRTDLRSYVQVNRSRLEKLLRQKRFPLLGSEIDRLLPEIELLQGAFLIVGGENKNKTLLESIAEASNNVLKRSSSTSKEHLDAMFASMLRVALGLPLYLSSLPPRQNPLEPTPPKEAATGRIYLPSGGLDPKAITNTAEVFTVSSQFKLSGLARLFFGLDGSEDEQRVVRDWVHANRKSCHWQPGYWRRRPRHGNDPTAPKVVQVEPHLVAKDRLPDFALPGGTLVKVL